MQRFAIGITSVAPSGFGATVAPMSAHWLAKFKFRGGDFNAHVAIQVNMSQVMSAVMFNVVTELVAPMVAVFTLDGTDQIDSPPDLTLAASKSITDCSGRIVPAVLPNVHFGAEGTYGGLGDRDQVGVLCNCKCGVSWMVTTCVAAARRPTGCNSARDSSRRNSSTSG